MLIVRIAFIWIGTILLMLSGFASARTIRLDPPYSASFHSLDAELPQQASPFTTRKPAILNVSTQLFTDTAIIDFEKRQITFRKVDRMGYTMWEYHYGELSDYLASRRLHAQHTAWKKESLALQNSNEATKKQNLKLEWEVPWQYPSWAQRVLGKDPPRLKIDGFLEILMGYQKTQYFQGMDNETSPDNDEFKFDINYSFGIQGSIGRLININIRADKEQNFDISNNLKDFKVEYKEITPGELEDEVIQEVTVGYTGFSMPGTNLSGYSESKEGLFGIKIRSKLGPVELTSIACAEQGQSNKKTYSSGSTNAGVRPLEAREYLKDKYFFLDNRYRKTYLQKYAPNGNNSIKPPRISTLSVWRNFQIMPTDKKSNIRKVHLDTTQQYYPFERLERDVHYYLNAEEGYIRFADSITFRAEQQVAIYLRVEDNSIERGNVIVSEIKDSVNGINPGDSVFTLWELRPKEPIDSLGQDTARYNLMWRNVYGPADFTDKTSFKIAVKRVDKDKSEDIEAFDNGSFYSDTMGLTQKNVPLSGKVQIYNTTFGDLIIPPFDTADMGLEPFNNPAFGEFRDSLIYKYGENHPNRKENYKNIWNIEMAGKRKQTTFSDLGWDIMQGTDLVKADGVTLERHKDYSISYSDGVIDLISARAKAAEKIEIEYQSGALFVPERKMFLGTHAKLELPFISDKSFAGTSILFQSTSSNDDIPKLDQEPYSKMLFDINAHLEFEPEWMTNLVKKIPLVQTDATSSITMDMELAHSRVNPNKSDQAYIDDFEDAKLADPLYNHADSWFRASPPVPPESLYFYPPAWETFWFSPVYSDEKHRVKQNEILLMTDAEKKMSQTGFNDEQVVRLHVVPAPPSQTIASRFSKSWTGLMTPISQSFADKRLMQYFEFFLKADSAVTRKGKLLIQMGVMREDISLDGKEPNGMEDREDTAAFIRQESYKEDLDKGWDKKPDAEEKYYIPGERAGTWDSITQLNPLLGADSLDPARDNYKKYNIEDDNYKNYRYACRHERDWTIEGSEDINYDGVVQTTTIEKYYQFTIDLDNPDLPFIDKSAKVNPAYKWRKYRIPLRERIPGTEALYDTINNPTWNNITMVRLIWTDFDTLNLTKEQVLLLNNLEFVGNQWIEAADSGVSKIKPSVINTKEDSKYDAIVKDNKNVITRERDQFGDEVEQSLRLNFTNLNIGDTALVRKNLEHQTLNLSAYQNLSLLVYGKVPDKWFVPNDTLDTLYRGDVRLVFRFGTDDSTYYQYSTVIRRAFNNRISINLKSISDLKDEALVANRDSAIIKDNPSGTLSIRAPRGRQPNFSRIRWMALGVIRDGAKSGLEPINGEIWINEMKLSGIKNIIGSASRIEVSTRWADLVTMQARMEYENGNFRRMTETQNLPDNTKVDGSMGATLSLDKFIPGRLGFALPVGVSYNSSVMRPQLKNETDVYLVDRKGNPDNFLGTVVNAGANMLGIERSKHSLSRAEEYQTTSMGRTYYTGYKKSAVSENPFVNLLAERWTADARYSTTAAEVRYGKNSAKDTLYAKCDTANNYSGKLTYDLTPSNPPEWTRWSPFKSVKQEWFPSPMKSYEFTFLPRKFTMDVADVAYGRQYHADTWRRMASSQSNFTVRHNTTIEYSPLSPLCDMSLSLGINRDLVEAVDDDTYEKGRKVFRRKSDWKDYMLLWGEKDRQQRMSFSFDPRIFNWLTSSANYANDYSANVVTWLKDPNEYLNTNVKSSFSLNGSFDLEVLLGDLKKATEKSILGGFVTIMKRGCDSLGLRSLSCTYTANSNLTNNYVGTRLLDHQSMHGMKDMLLYQTGIKGRSLWDIMTGNMNDRRYLGILSRDTSIEPSDFFINDSRVVDRSIRLSTTLTFRPIDLSFRQLSWNYSENFNLRPDTSRNDTTIIYPDISIGVSTGIFNRLDIVKKHLQNIDCNSTYSYRQSDRKTSQAGGATKSIKMDFMPLVSIAGSLKKWPVRFDYRHNFSTELSVAYTKKDEPPDTNKQVRQHKDEFSLSYEIEQGSLLNEIKFLTFTIPVKGRTSLGLKFERSAEIERITDRNDKSYSLVPNLSYIFTDNVTGRAEYRLAKTDRGGEKTSINDFSLTVKVNF